jgi:hypothetical protein
VNTATIDGSPCRHLVFEQPPGIELELWVEKNEHALPRRLIVTYHDLPGQPNFVAEMFGWDFSIHPAECYGVTGYNWSAGVTGPLSSLYLRRPANGCVAHDLSVALIDRNRSIVRDLVQASIIRFYMATA